MLISVTAVAEPGSTFSGWGGAYTGTDLCLVTMTAAQEVIASFALDEVSYSLYLPAIAKQPEAAD